MMSRSGVTGPVRWAVCSLQLAGEEVSGDLFAVLASGTSAVLAVIDGLGHGPNAEAASRAAVRALEERPDRSVAELLDACHRALTRTRGAVVSLARVEGSVLSWTGVGNVEAAVLRGLSGGGARERILLSNGVVGHAMPSFRVTTLELAPGDLVVFGTDGLESDFIERVDATASPEAVVSSLVLSHRTGRDDALALAARFDGEQRS